LTVSRPCMQEETFPVLSRTVKRSNAQTLIFSTPAVTPSNPLNSLSNGLAPRSVPSSVLESETQAIMIGAALRRAAKASSLPKLYAQSQRSMSSGPIDIATEIKELKKWKVRNPQSTRPWTAKSRKSARFRASNPGNVTGERVARVRESESTDVRAHVGRGQYPPSTSATPVISARSLAPLLPRPSSTGRHLPGPPRLRHQGLRRPLARARARRGPPGVPVPPHPVEGIPLGRLWPLRDRAPLMKM